MDMSTESSKQSGASIRPVLLSASSGIFWGGAAAVLALDQISKAWALTTLAPGPLAGAPRPSPSISIVPGCLRLEYAENTGAAFSLFQDHPGLLTATACLLAVAVLIWNAFLPPHERLSRLSLGLIFGGAVGNLVDRFRFGYVVDFIVAYWRNYAWPTFNVADSAICTGIGLFFLTSYLAARKASKAKREQSLAKARAGKQGARQQG